MIYDKQSRKRKKRLASAEQTGTGSEGATSNPLLKAWVTPFGLPPFDRALAVVQEELGVPGSADGTYFAPG